MLLGAQVRVLAAALLVWDFCGFVVHDVVLGLHQTVFLFVFLAHMRNCFDFRRSSRSHSFHRAAAPPCFCALGSCQHLVRRSMPASAIFERPLHLASALPGIERFCFGSRVFLWHSFLSDRSCRAVTRHSLHLRRHIFFRTFCFGPFAPLRVPLHPPDHDRAADQVLFVHCSCAHGCIVGVSLPHQQRLHQRVRRPPQVSRQRRNCKIVFAFGPYDSPGNLSRVFVHFTLRIVSKSRTKQETGSFPLGRSRFHHQGPSRSHFSLESRVQAEANWHVLEPNGVFDLEAGKTTSVAACWCGGRVQGVLRAEGLRPLRVGLVRHHIFYLFRAHARRRCCTPPTPNNNNAFLH